MPNEFRIIGSGRHAPPDFAAHVRRAIETHGRMELDDHWLKFSERLSFVASSAEDGAELAAAVATAEREIGATGERLVYLSVPPDAMREMVRMLGASGLADNCSLVVEKRSTSRAGRGSTSRLARSGTWFVDSWRWSGVPFYLRTGKAMAQGRRTVTIGFTEAPPMPAPYAKGSWEPGGAEALPAGGWRLPDGA